MTFKKLVTGLMTAATLSIGLISTPMAFAQVSPVTNLECRDSNGEWIYYPDGYDCNNVDRDNNVKPANPTPAPDNKAQCRDEAGNWKYDQEGLDCHGFDRPGFNPKNNTCYDKATDSAIPCTKAPEPPVVEEKKVTNPPTEVIKKPKKFRVRWENGKPVETVPNKPLN